MFELEIKESQSFFPWLSVTSNRIVLKTNTQSLTPTEYERLVNFCLYIASDVYDHNKFDCTLYGCLIIGPDGKYATRMHNHKKNKYRNFMEQGVSNV